MKFIHKRVIINKDLNNLVIKTSSALLSLSQVHWLVNTLFYAFVYSHLSKIGPSGGYSVYEYINKSKYTSQQAVM